MVQLQDQLADGFIASAAVELNEILRRERKLVLAGVMRGELFVHRLIGELAGLALIQHRQARVQAEFVKMLADEPEAETVQRADMREIETGKLFAPKVEG